MIASHTFEHDTLKFANAAISLGAIRVNLRKLSVTMHLWLRKHLRCNGGILITCSWTQEPVLPGCFLRARAIGLMPMIDQVFVTFCIMMHISVSSGLVFSLNRSWSLMTSMVLQGEKDDKIIAVCADDPEYRHFKDIKELPPHRLAEIRRFFEDCEAHLNSHLSLNTWTLLWVSYLICGFRNIYL